MSETLISKRYGLNIDATLDRFEKRQDRIEHAKHGRVLSEDDVPF